MPRVKRLEGVVLVGLAWRTSGSTSGWRSPGRTGAASRRPAVKAGRCIVSPRAISASMSWMKAFMRAMAKVVGLISWPKSRKRGDRRRQPRRPFCLHAVRLQQPQVALDQQARRAAAGVVDGHARAGGRGCGP